MSELIRKFMVAHEEYCAQAKAPWKKGDTNKISQLNDIRSNKQKPLLEQMNNDEINYIINNYAGIAQGKMYYASFLK